MTPAFQGEVQFRRYSDTSTQGQQVVFAVHGREELEAFIGKEGKRFMAVLVEIGDDERPASTFETPKPREQLGDLCYRAVMWCADTEFIKWANTTTHNGILWHLRDEKDAKEFICEMCGIQSRKELDTNPRAAKAFNELIRGPYHKYMRQAWHEQNS